MDNIKDTVIQHCLELLKRDDVKNELGDLLLHIVFYAKMGSEKKLFDINDIIKWYMCWIGKYGKLLIFEEENNLVK